LSREIDAMVAEKVMGLPREQGDWSPSTDIAAAWGVVEKMRDRGCYVAVQNCHSPETEWCAIIADDEDSYEGKGSAPIAICLAALKAVGVKVLPKGTT